LFEKLAAEEIAGDGADDSYEPEESYRGSFHT
jgi:hypothetical protein